MILEKIKKILFSYQNIEYIIGPHEMVLLADERYKRVSLRSSEKIDEYSFKQGFIEGYMKCWEIANK